MTTSTLRTTLGRHATLAEFLLHVVDGVCRGVDVSLLAEVPPVSTPAEFCRRALPGVSRTFALNIPVLPAPLDLTVTVAYLLCRIADTVEDEAHGGVGPAAAAERAGLLATLGQLARLEPGWPSAAVAFAQQAQAALRPSAPEAEVKLVAATPTVLAALAALPAWTHGPVAACVAEMTGGMGELILALEGAPPKGLPTLDDTLQYCYYVAGTVGVLLTRLFVHAYPAVQAHEAELTPLAPSFGRALQLTNILKDMREDHDRGFCWLPHTLLDHHGLTPATLVQPTHRLAAVALLDDLVAVARHECDLALEYVLLLPAEEPGLRLFCLWPLLFALRTLALLAHNPDVFEAAPVKIDRATVLEIVLRSRAHVADDHALRALFASCTEGVPLPGAR